ncbi:hypothetical protein B0H13DRAFT_1880897 [Mycena leptocephala]|nr:hypothetical protein B0H13DRAFT_1880897 [Mycena leptocephala]
MTFCTFDEQAHTRTKTIEQELSSRGNRSSSFLHTKIIEQELGAEQSRLDQVLLMPGNLYRIYGSSEINSHVRNWIRKSLEKRWLAMELFSTKNPALKPIGLYNIAKQLFIRFAPDLDFHAAFFDYSKDLREFFRAHMNLAEMKQLYERENKRVNVVKVWEQLDTGEKNGRNRLVKLAMWLLSIVANSAGSERGFSKFGIFISKLKSLLSIQRARKMNTIDMDLKRQQEELGLTTDWLKRKFAQFAEECAGEEGGSVGYDEADSFTSLSTQLICDLNDDRNNDRNNDGNIPLDEEAEEDEEDVPAVHSRSNYTLKELFQYPENDTESLENGLGFHWSRGLKDLQDELELYDLLMGDIDE